MNHSRSFLRPASLFCVLALTAALSTGCSGGDKKNNESKSAEAVSSEASGAAASEQESKSLGLADQLPESRKRELEDAVHQAKSYLQYFAYSRDGLIHQMEFVGYSTEDTTYAVDSLNVDWNEQAVKAVLDYIDVWDYSRQHLLKYLTEEKRFTQEQAEYGVDHCGADWKKAVALRAKEYMDIKKRPRDKLIEDLLKDGFTKEEAEYGADAVLK